MERLPDEMLTEYLKTAAPVLQHMHAAMVPMVRADETLLDHFDTRKMMIKVLADAGDAEALYQCGLMTDAGYEHCLKAARKVKETGLTAFTQNKERTVAEPSALKIAKYLKDKNDYVPFDLRDTDFALMMQGAAQLFEMLHFDRSAFVTDLAGDLPQKSWHSNEDQDRTTYMLLFHLTALGKGLKRILPAQKMADKTHILLEALVTHFFQRACHTLYKEGEKRHVRLQNGGFSCENTPTDVLHLNAVRRTVELKKSERMMALGYIFERFAGARLAYSAHRQTMLLSGLVYAMREEIERGDFSLLFQNDNPHKHELGLCRQKQVLRWYDKHTAPFLKTVSLHVQTGVNQALRHLRRPSNERS